MQRLKITIAGPIGSHKSTFIRKVLLPALVNWTEHVEVVELNTTTGNKETVYKTGDISE